MIHYELLLAIQMMTLAGLNLEQMVLQQIFYEDPK